MNNLKFYRIIDIKYPTNCGERSGHMWMPIVFQDFVQILRKE